MIIKVIVAGILLMIVAIGIYIYNNLTYYKKPIRRTKKAGFVEKQAVLPDGTLLNYGEGPNNGPPLLLLHAQIATWQNYAPVLPELSKHYHIYAVDCHGHGKSSYNPLKYSAEEIGKDFIWFIENVIKERAIISGNSSGGLLTAWIAANSPKNVLGIVLEDPPFFSCELERCESTFAWVDSFKPVHEYLQQSKQKDYITYYLEHCYWLSFFGNGREGILKYAKKYRSKYPNKRLEIFFLPPSINKTFWSMDMYDPKFGNSFYDCSFMKNFNHAETLAKIDCPSVLLHANWKYDDNNILLAAMDDKDANRASSLIKNNKLIKLNASHVIHSDKPKEFIRIMIEFLNDIK